MSRVLGAALQGVEGVPVEVEVRISSQLPKVDVVGLPEAAVRESAARVRAAIASSGLEFPQHRVTVNLAPAEVRKSGAGLDLAIAVGVLAASGHLECGGLDGIGMVGELALDGRLRAVRGALALTLALRDAGCRRVVVPAPSAAEAALAPGIEVLSAPDLRSVCGHLHEAGEPLETARPARAATPVGYPELSDVRGQEHAKRALEIAAAGGHAIFLRGTPGCGKTMLARRLPGLLPPPSFEEALAVTRIHGAAGQLGSEAPIVSQRPFRAPHHTASTAGLLGGGQPPRPGEVSLAHHGVLFLDELPEFQRSTLEALRQVLEDRRVVIARARSTCVFPAHVQLVTAANPCPCGWRGSPSRDCRCDDEAVARYAARVSGPLLDRIDLHLSLQAVPWSELDAGPLGPSTREVAARVTWARRRATGRLGTTGGSNAEIPDARLDDQVAATPEARALLGRAVERLALSARAARRVLRVARTIADLAGEAKTPAGAVAEALSYRDDWTRPAPPPLGRSA
ncbi:MAG: YifB family Mg chelatase-like AAA ATPase [Myxococcota bacterium]|nr:YifB family Mg chelatase-like AAA ATPase [Myxococcota bacterium]